MGRSKHADAGPVTENADVHSRRLILAIVRHVVPHHPHLAMGQAGGVAVIFAVQLPGGDVVVRRYVDLMSVREFQVQVSGSSQATSVHVAPEKSNSDRSWTAGSLGSIETTSTGEWRWPAGSG
jgi:2-methylaconitate cis-trans-isomerase PrpF